MVVEVMGRYAGWITLHSGLSGTADVILIPEIPHDINEAARKILYRARIGRHFSVVVVAEEAVPRGGAHLTVETSAGGRERLGGRGRK